MLGIVGKMGVGKIMILKLLFCEFDVRDGVVLWGGKDIKDYVFDLLYKSIGYVF